MPQVVVSIVTDNNLALKIRESFLPIFFMVCYCSNMCINFTQNSAFLNMFRRLYETNPRQVSTINIHRSKSRFEPIRVTIRKIKFSLKVQMFCYLQKSNYGFILKGIHIFTRISKISNT